MHPYRAGQGSTCPAPARGLTLTLALLLPARRRCCRLGTPRPQEDLHAAAAGVRLLRSRADRCTAERQPDRHPSGRDHFFFPACALTWSTMGRPVSRRHRSSALAAPSTSSTSMLNCKAAGTLSVCCRQCYGAPQAARSTLTHARPLCCCSDALGRLPYILLSRITSPAFTKASATTLLISTGGALPPDAMVAGYMVVMAQRRVLRHTESG